MKKRILVIVATILLIIVALVAIPVYKTSVQACNDKVEIRKSLVAGDSKQSIQAEAAELVQKTTQYDCNLRTISYRLHIL